MSRIEATTAAASGTGSRSDLGEGKRVEALFVTDIHGHTAALAELPAADLLILGGDLTHFGSTADVEAVLDRIPAHCGRVLAVLGNCDPPSGEAVLRRRGAALHHRVVDLGTVRLMGWSGSNVTPGGTPYEWADETASGSFGDLASVPSADRSPVIVVSHAPPYGYGPDRLPNGRHVGSRAVAELVRRLDAPGVLCGHIHEARGVFSHGGTILLNPGPFKDGFYGRVRFTELAGMSATLARL